MEHPRHVSRSVAAALILALVITGTVRSAGAQNTSLGTGALSSNTTGTNDTALGFDALFANTTGNSNIATGDSALASNTTGGNNTAIGSAALDRNTTGADNTATGFQSLNDNTSGADNTAIGFATLNVNKTGNDNTATGFAALNNSTGADNTATGFQALLNNTTGNNNIAIGSNAGSNLTSGSNNLDIGNPGVAGESNVIRIGTKGFQTRTFIAGISGNPVYVGSPVLVNANGRLGVAVSSARYKRDIRDMGEASGGLMKLRPVSFRYKQDPNGTLQYGLIAEEVARVYPELVTYGDDGKPQSVAYHVLPAMLLNELQKKDAQIVALQKQIESLQKKTALIDTLTARLRALEQQARTARPEHLAAATR
jgi:hypothetical protein